MSRSWTWKWLVPCLNQSQSKEQSKRSKFLSPTMMVWPQSKRKIFARSFKKDVKSSTKLCHKPKPRTIRQMERQRRSRILMTLAWILTEKLSWRRAKSMRSKRWRPLRIVLIGLVLLNPPSMISLGTMKIKSRSPKITRIEGDQRSMRMCKLKSAIWEMGAGLTTTSLLRFKLGSTGLPKSLLGRIITRQQMFGHSPAQFLKWLLATFYSNPVKVKTTIRMTITWRRWWSFWAACLRIWRYQVKTPANFLIAVETSGESTGWATGHSGRSWRISITCVKLRQSL